MIAGYTLMIGEEKAIEEVDLIMSEVDTDANGYIEYSEFIMASVKKENLLSK